MQGTSARAGGACDGVGRGGVGRWRQQAGAVMAGARGMPEVRQHMAGSACDSLGLDKGSRAVFRLPDRTCPALHRACTVHRAPSSVVHRVCMTRNVPPTADCMVPPRAGCTAVHRGGTEQGRTHLLPS
jgi:hypothetical protein